MITLEERTYTFSTPGFSILRDGLDDESLKRLLFHVESDDYFATLATILALVKDQLETAAANYTSPDEYSMRVLQTMHDDLVYLAQHYRIEQKNTSDPRM